MRMALVLAILLGPLGISSGAEPSTKRQLRPDHAPTPYSAAEIAARCVHGCTVVFELESPRGKVLQQTRFLLPDAEGVDIETANLNPRTGKPFAKPGSARATWKTLQSHGSFPKANTTITDGVVETPAGRFECRVYTVTVPSGKRVLYFANGLAGQPVKFLAFDHDGKQMLSVTLVRQRPFDFPTYFGDQEWEGRSVRKEVAYAASASIVARTGESPRAVVVASLRITEGRPFRHAALRVTKGALKGAILRLTPESNPVPRMIAAQEFELPKRWQHEPTPLEFEVVDLR